MQSISFNEQSTAIQLVKTAINIACTHHESQLAHFTKLMNENNESTAEIERLMAIYDQYASVNESSEMAFRAFLTFLCE